MVAVEANFEERVLSIANFVDEVLPDTQWSLDTSKISYEMYDKENMFIVSGKKTDLLQLGMQILRFANNPLNADGSHFHIDNSGRIESDAEIMIEMIPESPEIKEAK